MKNYSVVLKAHDKLGEGPVYDPKNDTLYWVDISGMKLNSMDLSDGTVKTVRAPGRISSVGLTDHPGELLASVELGIYDFSLEEERFEKLGEVKEEGTIFNDGKPDPLGAYVVGTKDVNEAKPIGSLYAFEGQRFKRILSGLTVSNGLAWNTEEQTFYHIDSPTRVVMSYRYGGDGLSDQKVALDLRNEAGVPDGMTIDSEGMLWIAHWGGGKVTRWDPRSGRKLEEIQLPARRISCPAFGGADLATLFVTSAEGGDEFGGSLFAVKTEVRGIEPFRFRAPS